MWTLACLNVWLPSRQSWPQCSVDMPHPPSPVTSCCQHGSASVARQMALLSVWQICMLHHMYHGFPVSYQLEWLTNLFQLRSRYCLPDCGETAVLVAILWDVGVCMGHTCRGLVPRQGRYPILCLSDQALYSLINFFKRCVSCLAILPLTAFFI